MMNDKPFPYSFFEGKVVPTVEAKLSIMTNALQYGTAVFGGIRGYMADDRKTVNIFRIEDHYRRFLNALRILNTKIPYDLPRLVEITLDLARRNKPDTDCYFRPFAYASNLGLSPDMSQAVFDFLLYQIPLGEYLPIHKGICLMSSSWQRIADTMIPARAKISGGYINSAMARGEAVKHGYDDALMLNASGHITEGSAANFFMVRDGILITPPKYSDVLEGITRNTILQLAHDSGIPTEEREIDRTEVYIAQEAFLCGTGVQVSWISEMDQRVIGLGEIGPITEKIQQLFFSIVRGKEKKYSHWLTKV